MPTPTEGGSMSRRSRALLCCMALAVLASVVSIPALTSAQGSGGRDITVRDKVRAAKFVHQKQSTRGERLAMGDRVITQQALFDESNRPVGTLLTDCVNVGGKAQVFKATLECSSIYRFRDGQVVS